MAIIIIFFLLQYIWSSSPAFDFHSLPFFYFFTRFAFIIKLHDYHGIFFSGNMIEKEEEGEIKKNKNAP